MKLIEERTQGRNARAGTVGDEGRHGTKRQRDDFPKQERCTVPSNSPPAEKLRGLPVNSGSRRGCSYAARARSRRTTDWKWDASGRR